MDILLIVVLIIIAILLFLAELFLLPGISIAGILSAGCILYANYHAFTYMGTMTGCITLTVSIIAFIISLICFMRSKTLDKISLKKQIKGNVNINADYVAQVGDTGITTTRLALIGYAEIKDHIVEVKSTGELIDAQTPIRIVRIINNMLLVEKL
ncbi:MAG: nodulation efficiency protein D (NfeD) [Mediterranea massiliensis]|nr:nodulation efficiency protein D (NfeD) [Mediterranea massiliensis]